MYSARMDGDPLRVGESYNPLVNAIYDKPLNPPKNEEKKPLSEYKIRGEVPLNEKKKIKFHSVEACGTENKDAISISDGVIVMNKVALNKEEVACMIFNSISSEDLNPSSVQADSFTFRDMVGLTARKLSWTGDVITFAVTTIDGLSYCESSNTTTRYSNYYDTLPDTDELLSPSLHSFFSNYTAIHDNGDIEVASLAPVDFPIDTSPGARFEAASSAYISIMSDVIARHGYINSSYIIVQMSRPVGLTGEFNSIQHTYGAISAELMQESIIMVAAKRITDSSDSMSDEDKATFLRLAGKISVAISLSRHTVYESSVVKKKPYILDMHRVVHHVDATSTSGSLVVPSGDLGFIKNQAWCYAIGNGVVYLCHISVLPSATSACLVLPGSTNYTFEEELLKPDSIVLDVGNGMFISPDRQALIDCARPNRAGCSISLSDSVREHEALKEKVSELEDVIAKTNAGVATAQIRRDTAEIVESSASSKAKSAVEKSTIDAEILAIKKDIQSNSGSISHTEGGLKLVGATIGVVSVTGLAVAKLITSSRAVIPGAVDWLTVGSITGAGLGFFPPVLLPTALAIGVGIAAAPVVAAVIKESGPIVASLIDIGSSMWEFASTIIPSMFSDPVSLLSTVGSAAVEALSGAVSSVCSSMWEFSSTIIPSMFSAPVSLLSAVGSAVGSAAVEVLSTLGSAAVEVLSGAVSSVCSVASSIGSVASGMFRSLTSWW